MRVKISKERVKREISSFQKELKKHLTTFITGSFAFVAALLWRDAISSFLETYKELIQTSLPFKELWIVKFFTAIAVSFVAVLGIVVVSRFLKD